MKTNNEDRTPYIVEKRFLNVRSLADYLGVDPKEAAILGAKACASIRMGSRLLYDLKAIDAFVDAKIQEQLANAPSLKAVEETLAQRIMDDYGVTKNTAKKLLAEVLISDALMDAISEEACEVQRRSWELEVL